MKNLSAAQWKGIIVAGAVFAASIARVFVPSIPDFDITHAVDVLAALFAGGALIRSPGHVSITHVDDMR